MNRAKIGAGDTGNEAYEPRPYVQLTHPDWSKNAVIYEVNIRQYTAEGTFRAFASHLPRLKELGADILWLMPVHPIGMKNRKGSLGSYYAVRDYYGVNPEFGTPGDLRDLIARIHELGMHVLLDWVANHSAWDNPLTLDHPEWYTLNASGRFQPTPWYDWDDVIDFDFGNPGIRAYMTRAMRHWVEEYDVDGFRCDVAGFVPVDFWEGVRARLESVKPVFMLAEWESRDLHHKAFDATYAWSLWERMRDTISLGKGIYGLLEYIAHDVSAFPADGMRLTFTDNHDKNSWEGGQYAAFGQGLEAAIVFAATVRGIPLVYGGQEAGLDRALPFFEKSSIEWKEHPNSNIYRTLFSLKHRNQALWNGAWGGGMVRINHDRPDSVIAFIREKNGDAVLGIFNFSDKPLEVALDLSDHPGNYREVFNGREISHLKGISLKLNAWGYSLFEKVKN